MTMTSQDQLELFAWVKPTAEVIPFPVARWGRTVWRPVAMAVADLLSNPVNEKKAAVIWAGLAWQIELQFADRGIAGADIAAEIRKARQFVAKEILSRRAVVTSVSK